LTAGETRAIVVTGITKPRRIAGVKWVMLIYKLPRSKSTATKVALWRKLKKLGVYPVQDSVCILPDSEKNFESFEWLAAELREAGGDASVWQAETLTPVQEKEMKNHFFEQVNQQYRQIIEDAVLVRSEKDLKNLWLQYNRVRLQDYLKSPLSVEAKAACEKRASEFLKKEEAI
jgi:hypothetical protein